MRELTIAGRRIADDTEAFVIAEIGCNHQGSVETARQLIQAASEAGCDAVKFQKRHLSTWAQRDPEGWAREYNSEHAFGRTYGEHRAALEFGRDQYSELKTFAEDRGLVFFATAFDLPSLELLCDLGVPAIKLASASIVDLPLLDACAVAGLPVIASTGGATEAETDIAVQHLRGRSPLVFHNFVGYGQQNFALLQCTATYPCEPEDMNLCVIRSLRSRYADMVIGLSDHQSGIAMAPVAYTLGARIFEKHFTLHRAWKGSDQAFSLEPGGMRRMVRDLRRTRQAMGDGVKRRLEAEVPALVKMGRTDLARERLMA